MRSSPSLERLDGAFDGTPLVADAGSAPPGHARPAARHSGGAPRSPVTGHRGSRVMTDSDGKRWAPVGGLRVRTDSQLDGSRTPPDGRVTTDSVGRRSRTTCSANWQSGRQALIGAPRTEPLVTHGRDPSRTPEAGAHLPRSPPPARNRRRRRPARGQPELAIGRRDRPGGAVSLLPAPDSAVRGLVSRRIGGSGFRRPRRPPSERPTRPASGPPAAPGQSRNR